MKNPLLSICALLVLVSCSDIIEVPNISNDTVTLVAPSDHASLDMTTLTLSWNPVEDAESYQVQVARPDFEDILQLEIDSTLIGNSISVELEAGNSYQWRVRAKNSGYTTPYTTYSFSLE